MASARRVDGLFAQGNFGIVTKMGFWLMPQPEAWLTGTVNVPKYSDFGPLVEHCNYLEDAMIAIGQPIYFSRSRRASAGGQSSAAGERLAIRVRSWIRTREAGRAGMARQAAVLRATGSHPGEVGVRPAADLAGDPWARRSPTSRCCPCR